MNVLPYPMCDCGHRHDHHRDDGDPRGGGCWRCCCTSYAPLVSARPLSQTQAVILDFITECVRARGYPPSVREIGDAVGLTSTSSVVHQLEVLAGRGYIVRDPRKPRAIKVLPPGEATVVAADVEEWALGTRHCCPPCGVFVTTTIKPMDCSTPAPTKVRTVCPLCSGLLTTIA